MTYWLKVAKIFKELNNYSGLIQIMSALNSNAIFRLKNTKKILEQYEDSVHFETLSEFNAMFSVEKISNIRDIIEQTQGPCIPWLGVLFHQLIHIQENPHKVPDDPQKGVVNFCMRKHLATILLKVDSYQNKPYHFNLTKQPIIDIITKSTILTENEAFERSKQIEPPVGSITPKNTSRTYRPSFIDSKRRSTNKNSSSLPPRLTISTPAHDSSRLHALISPRSHRSGTTQHPLLSPPTSPREATRRMQTPPSPNPTRATTEETLPHSQSNPSIHITPQWESASPRKDKKPN